MNILAIDTSCDETSAAVTQKDCILSNVVSSQVNLHKKWGGVVPDIARRAHTENIEAVINEALQQASLELSDIDYFAATYGPGLAIALEIGLKKAQALALSHSCPFIPVNHMEGHLVSSFAKNSKGGHPGTAAPDERNMPMMGLLISGGHTELILMHDFGTYEKIGETLDDAAGEAFDKVAKMLDLGYPGGPIISEFAKKGTPGRFSLPTPMEKSDNLNFSYSGLKTACLYMLKEKQRLFTGPSRKEHVYDFCADFVEAVTQSVVLKLDMAVRRYPVNGILLGGGVISNVTLRRRIRSAMRKHNLPVYQPYTEKLFTDNAGMIGIAGYFMAIRKDPAIAHGRDIEIIDRDPVAEIGV